jgi:Tfp pilus assembly protein PilE
MIELILVMLLLSVMIAIAVPSIRGFAAGSRSRDAVTELVATAQWAKARAAADAKVVRLNVAGESYWLTAQQGMSYERVEGEFGEPVMLTRGARVEIVPAPGAAGGAAVDTTGICFYPDGRTDPALLRLIGEDGRVRLLGCPSPAESFRVMTEEEASSL